MDPAAQRAWLESQAIDADVFARAEALHLQELARRTSEGDMSLAKEHSENLRRKLADEPLSTKGAYDSTLDAPPSPMAAPLPFVRAVSIPPAVVPQGAVDPAGETLPGVGPKDDTLPFANASGEVRFLQLEAFARVSADLRQAPRRRSSVLERYGLSDTTFLSIAQLWSTRFNDNPTLRENFEALVRQRTNAKEEL
jgi:hypothetical protein